MRLLTARVDSFTTVQANLEAICRGRAVCVLERALTAWPAVTLTGAFSTVYLRRCSALDMIPAMRSVEFDVEAATRSLEVIRSDGPRNWTSTTFNI
jgi:hypothetical protein